MTTLKKFMLVAASFATLTFSACNNEEPTPPAPLDADEQRICGNVCAGECVAYARCKVPSLPFGLFTYQDKLNIINSRTLQQGSIAIINTGNNVGHVAYVQYVHSNGEITISEANWIAGRCGTRRGTPARLNIVGYFRP
jgi:hypothetical protein